jgi:hypothetical protein
VSMSPKFQVDGEWFPIFTPTELGTPGDESTTEKAQRIAHLREARAREAERFRCPTCGLPGARLNGGDKFHGPGLCDRRGGAS